MKLLAIETCTEACSAALLVNDELTERYELAPRRHTELILVMVDSLLTEADLRPVDLDGLAFGRGPGAFSGVRVGCSAIQALAFATDLPVAPVSSLAALAYAAHLRTKASHVLVAIDARMQEVYWAAYRFDDHGSLHVCCEERVEPADQIQLPDTSHWLATGSGCEVYKQVIQSRLQSGKLEFETGQYPQASAVAKLGAAAIHAGQFVSAADAQPIYLRNNVATPKALV